MDHQTHANNNHYDILLQYPHSTHKALDIQTNAQQFSPFFRKSPWMSSCSRNVAYRTGSWMASWGGKWSLGDSLWSGSNIARADGVGTLITNIFVKTTSNNITERGRILVTDLEVGGFSTEGRQRVRPHQCGQEGLPFQKTTISTTLQHARHRGGEISTVRSEMRTAADPDGTDPAFCCGPS